ncbi:MAG TPA: hypothetical protein IGR64_01725 [Leptolyngbyaceae cyanobacterium M65_K2018_010]|nr:hypothetical protein [Leptolyngbyaceae cyanobacterium M65_K2018_010]
MVSSLPTLVALAFLPAGLGLLIQVGWPGCLADRLAALALLLLVGEQAHMARVDLRHLAGVSQPRQDPQLQCFTPILGGTILGELVGFYGAAAGFLGIGLLLIAVSLLAFNGVTPIRFGQDGQLGVQPLGSPRRLGVIAVDSLALALAVVWLMGLAQLWIAIVLLSLTLLYGAIKLIGYIHHSKFHPGFTDSGD